MQIPCPWCGLRDEGEFVCAGTAHLARPPLDADGETWAHYLFFRENPKGPHAERWRHVHGCGQWFNLSRNTVTHEITAVYAITDAAPR
jgi:sarcosine oxidase subunit delta